MGIPLRIAEPAGSYRRQLRRYALGDETCPGGFRYHNAEADIGEVTEAEAERIHGDNWPHDDPRWPTACTCGYRFTGADRWQRNDNLIYLLPDGTEFTKWGRPMEGAPPGAMIRADWFDGYSGRPGEAWLVILPDGGQWITTQQATDGGYWEVTGTPPDITVTPSIFHNAPHGWHGFIRNGELVPA